MEFVGDAGFAFSGMWNASVNAYLTGLTRINRLYGLKHLV